MKAALHRHDCLAGQRAADEPAGVRCNRRVREMRNVPIRDRDGGVDVLGEAAEAGAENDADPRLGGPAGADGLGGFLNLVVELEHGSHQGFRCQKSVSSGQG